MATFDDKVILATLTLEGEVERWWALKQMVLPSLLTWESFLEAFNAKYFLDFVHHKKEKEFSNLQQEDKIVVKYTKKFRELDRHAPEVMTIEGKKARTF